MAAAVIVLLGASFPIDAEGGIVFPEIFGAAFDGEDANVVVLDRPTSGCGDRWRAAGLPSGDRQDDSPECCDDVAHTVPLHFPHLRIL